MIPRIVTTPGAFRVFRGYRRDDLDEEAFLSELGEVFMPGTPLMLRDLGLAAYLPSVLPVVDSVPDFPDEVALIAYASRERYSHARNETVTGRMYTHTHRAVFDMGSSAAGFAEKIGPIAEPVTQFWCHGQPRDWQADGEVLCWAGHRRDADDVNYPGSVVGTLAKAFPTLEEAGVLEVIGQVAADWTALWALVEGWESDLSGAETALRSVMEPSVEVASVRASRVAWIDEPPVIAVERPSAWNLLFARDPRHFLA